MPEIEAKHVRKIATPLLHQYVIGDEFWVLVPNQSKLQPKKISPTVVVEMHHKNT